MASTPAVSARTTESDSPLALRVLAELRADSAPTVESLRGQTPPELDIDQKDNHQL